MRNLAVAGPAPRPAEAHPSQTGQEGEVSAHGLQVAPQHVGEGIDRARVSASDGPQQFKTPFCEERAELLDILEGEDAPRRHLPSLPDSLIGSLEIVQDFLQRFYPNLQRNHG